MAGKSVRGAMLNILPPPPQLRSLRQSLSRVHCQVSAPLSSSPPPTWFNSPLSPSTRLNTLPEAHNRIEDPKQDQEVEEMCHCGFTVSLHSSAGAELLTETFWAATAALLRGSPQTPFIGTDRRPVSRTPETLKLHKLLKNIINTLQDVHFCWDFTYASCGNRTRRING